MLRRSLRFLTWIVLLAPGGPCFADGPPFWRFKEKYYARVKAGEPVVAVSTSKLEGAKRRLTIVGGGRVKVGRDFAYDFARRLDRVARLSGYVETAEENAAHDRLHLVFKALGQRAEFDLGVKRDDDRRRVSFEILGGPLRGLTADLSFGPITARETEVAIDGRYDFEKAFLKGTLLTVGLEGVFKAMAERLRDGVERAAKDVDKNPAPVEDSAAPRGG